MNKKILIVLANYYKDISDGLLKSALKNIPSSNSVKIIRVPGVFAIPDIISKNSKGIESWFDYNLIKAFEGKKDFSLIAFGGITEIDQMKKNTYGIKY